MTASGRPRRAPRTEKRHVESQLPLGSAGPLFPSLRRFSRHGGGLPPGVYRLGPQSGHGSLWSIENAHDLTVVADGVTIIGTRLTRAVEIENCRGVTLQGLTVDYAPLPFTQGAVVAVAADRSSIEVKLDAGYPRRPYSHIDVVDPKTRFRKKGMPFLWGTKPEMSGPDTVRVTLKGIGDAASVGDLASLSGGPGPDGVAHGIEIHNCVDTTLRGVTVHTAPGTGIVASDGEGRARYLACRVVPGPKPAGATQERLLSTIWDAMPCKTVKQGPRVEDCVSQNAGDDSWSVQSSDYLVVKRVGRTLTVATRDEWTDGPQVGDRLQKSLDGPDARIVSRQVARRPDAGLGADVLARLTQAPRYALWDVSPKCFVLTLDRDPSFDVGVSVFAPDRHGNGFVFRHNRLHSAGRLLIKAGGLIEGNLLETSHALVVCPEP